MKTLDLINWIPTRPETIPTIPEKTEPDQTKIRTANIAAGECECPPPPPPSQRKIVGRIWA